MADRFGIKPEHAEHVKRLYEARNCLTHDLGTVLPKRCKTNGEFVITWIAPYIVTVGQNSGTEKPVTDLIGAVTEEPMNVVMRIESCEIRLKAGDTLKFSQQDLWEICFFFNAHAIPATMRAFVDFLKREGVQVAADNSAAHKG